MDIIREVINEIALSGLEGVTLTGLWTLLAERSPPILDINDEEMKNFIWKGIIQCDQIEFWWVNANRKVKSSSQRSSKALSQNDEDECGSTKKLPSGWISDAERGICGYCPNYELREVITEQVCNECKSPGDAYNKWEENLYVVGSVRLRRSTLYGEESPQNLSMTDFRYVFLELIGKSRHNGLLQADFCKYSMDPRSSFHFIKILIKLGLVTKQRFCFMRDFAGGAYQRLIKTNILFLKHFHRTVRTYQDELEGRALEELSKAPGNMIELNELKEILPCSRKIFKVIRNMLFENGSIQFIKDGKILNFRVNKDSLTSKPSSPIYVQAKNSAPKRDADNENDNEEMDEESLYVSKCKHHLPQLLPSVPKIQQMYWIFENAKEKGITSDEFGSRVCVPYRTARSVIRHFCSRGLLKGLATDKSRQKVAHYISTNYIHESKMYKDLNSEVSIAKDLEMDENTDSGSPGRRDKKDTDGGDKMEQPGTKKKANSSEKQSKSKSNLSFASEDQVTKQRGFEQTNKVADSAKGIRRQNKLLQRIKETKVIEGSNTLYKFILQSEAEYGLKERVCRKSIHRLLERMLAGDMIKKYEVVVPYGDGTFVNIVYYCDANVTMTDDVFKTAVNETKFRLKGIVEKRQIRGERSAEGQRNKGKNLTCSSHVSLLDFITEKEADNDDGTSKRGDETDTDDEEYEPVTGTAYQRPQYGYLPRFPRLQMLHVYVWQLVYGTGENVAEYADALSQAQQKDETTEIRKDQFRWLTSLGKLPQNRLGKGYFQAGDALAIMPLEVFSQCIGICRLSNTIAKLLADPIKRYTPLRDLPPRLKSKLFRGKSAANYNGHFTESLILLTHMGLLQVTSEKLPSQRAHIVMYVCKEAKLVDTTLSEKGYSKIKLPSSLKSFPELFFKFDDLNDISKYWRDVQCVCLSTRLGAFRGRHAKNVRSADDEPLEKSQRVSRAMMTLKDIQGNFSFHDPTSAPPFICGDGLGAAGFDSTFFGHLHKNWFKSDGKKRHLSMVHAKATLQASEKPIQAPLGGFKKRTVNSVVAKASIGGRGKKRKRGFDNKILSDAPTSKKASEGGSQTEKSDAKQPDFTKLKKLMASRYQQKLAQKHNNGKDMVRKRAKTDAADIAALKQKRGLRVRFCQKEDSAILIAQVAASLLELGSKNVFYWPVARDIFHKLYSESRDKTTESLSRRSRNLFKNQLTVQNFKSCLLECQTDPNFTVQKPSSYKDGSWKTVFIELFPRVMERFQKRLDMSSLEEDLPETLKELKEYFIVSGDDETKAVENFIKIPTKKEVVMSTIEQLLHNSLVSRRSKDYLPSLIFNAFNQYPEELVEQAMFRMKAKGMVAKMRFQVSRSMALPLSTMTFSLSVLYMRIFELPLPKDLFQDAAVMVRLIKDGRKHARKYRPCRKKNNEAENVDKDKEEVENMEDDIDLKDDNVETAGEQMSAEPEGVNQSENPDESTSLPATPGLLQYSRESCIGGHVAGILSLLVNEKGSLDMDIPDEMLDIDQSFIEEEVESGNQQGTGMITFLKRKIYSRNIEDALIVNDENEEAMSNDGDDRKSSDANDADDCDDDDDDSRMHGDGSMEKTGAELNSDSSVKSNLSPMLDTSKDVRNKESSFEVKTPKRSCLKISDGIDCGESAVLRKQRKVMFDAPRLNVQDSCKVFDESETERHRVVAGTSADQNVKGSQFEGEGEAENVDSIKKGIGIGETPMNVCFTGNVNHKLRTTSGNVSFLSDQSYIDTFAGYQDKHAKYSNLSQEFSYVDDVDQGAGKGAMTIVPKRSLEVRKTKLHASRITLMLHRSIDQESESFQKRLYKSYEQLILRPIAMSVYLKPKPHSGDDLSMQNRSDNSVGRSWEQEGSDAMGVNNTKMSKKISSEEESLCRFMKTERIPLTKSELECPLSDHAIDSCIYLMKQSFNLTENEVAFLKEVLKEVLRLRELGLTENQFEAVYSKYQNLRPWDELLQMLLNFRVLLKVGKFTRRYVARGYASDWCFHIARAAHDNEDLGHETEKEADFPVEESATNGAPVRTTSGDEAEQMNRRTASFAGKNWEGAIGEEREFKGDKNGTKMQKNENRESEGVRIEEKETKYLENKVVKKERKYDQRVCKPWLKLDGEINLQLLRKFQQSILSLIMMCPGITESAICGHYRAIMTRTAVVDILEFLELNCCVVRHVSAKRNTTKLFDSWDNAVLFEPLENDPYYVPTADCVLNIADELSF